MAAALALACADFDLVRPEGNVPPQLHVGVVVLQEDSTRYDAAVYLSPGSDADGRPRTVTEPQLVIEGDVVTSHHSEPQLQSYVWHDVLPAGTAPRTFVAVQGPRIAGFLPTPQLNIPVPGRLDPYRMVHVIGGDLSLAIRPVPPTPAGLGRIGNGFWQLQVAPAQPGPPLIGIQGLGAVPSPLVIPSGWLQSRVTAGDTLLVTLHLQNAFEALSAPYPTVASIFAEIRWRVRVIAP